MNLDNRAKLAGIFTPNMTIFTDEKVDLRKIEANLERYNETRLRGYMPLGSNGEFASLSDEESLKIAELYANRKSADKTLIVGASRESVYVATEFINRVADLGADYASLLPAHYFAGTMDDAAMIRFYVSIADAVSIPIMVYNAPKFCGGVTVTPEVVTECAKHPNIAGMKDTSSEDIRIYTEAVAEGEDFNVLAGTINKLYYGLTVGAVGGVVSMANYVPDKCVELCDVFYAGHDDEGTRQDEYLRDLSSRAAGKYGVAGVKAAMELLGFHGGAPRLPLLPIEERSKTRLKNTLDAEGLL